MSEPRSWCTICPLLNLDVGLKIPVYFSKGLWLTMIPDWLRLDGSTELLSSPDREALKQLQYSFVVEYEAPASGAPDPDWDGPEPRSIQDAKVEVASLANLAMWLAKPSPAGFELVFHAPRWAEGWNVQNSDKRPRLRCHPKDRYAMLADHDLERATNLHAALCALSCKNAIWSAVRSAWAALESRNVEVRILLLWDALDALFDTDDGRERESRLPQRIGAFVANGEAGTKATIERAERAYRFMRRVVHGDWGEQADLSDSVYEAEVLVRGALGRILSDDALIARFCRDRESYLEGLLSAREART